MNKNIFSHVDQDGNANMVDVSNKADTKRIAIAKGEIKLKPKTLKMVTENQIKKGDVLTTAKIAAIQAAKRTWEIIPLCHNIFLHGIDVDFKINTDQSVIEIYAEITTSGKTGAEMEALHAVSTAGLTIYDMIKAVEKTAVINNIRLVRKTGGKSGDVINE